MLTCSTPLTWITSIADEEVENEDSLVTNEESLVTTYKSNEVYNAHMKPVLEYARTLKFSTRQETVRHRETSHDVEVADGVDVEVADGVDVEVADGEDVEVADSVDFDALEIELYDFARPIVINDDQLITTIGDAYPVPFSKPIKKLEIEIGIFINISYSLKNSSLK